MGAIEEELRRQMGGLMMLRAMATGFTEAQKAHRMPHRYSTRNYRGGSAKYGA